MEIPDPISTTTPGWIGRVWPAGTVQSQVAIYGLPELDHVPEMLPQTRVWALAVETRLNAARAVSQTCGGRSVRSLHIYFSILCCGCFSRRVCTVSQIN